MPDSISDSNQIDTLPKRINFWQILEGKSAYSEGLIATDVLFLNHFVNLRISALGFVATKSPLSKFFSGIYLSPIKTELDYIEQRVKLISDCKKLLANLFPNTEEFFKVEDVIWLLKFQLYGFGQKLICDGKILYGLIAFKEAGVLAKEKIKQNLKRLSQEFPQYKSIISEFI